VKPVVAAYTCPLWHPSAHFAEGFGAGWSEYTVMRGARPWFDAHHQPRTPLLGERDESSPETWELYNQVAAAHGVDVLVWDTYWYDGRPALHEALDDGFLRAANRDVLDFAVMWTNHPWSRGEPLAAAEGTLESDSVEECRRSLSFLVARYLHEPNYWHIDGKPVVVIWDSERLWRGLGAEQAAELLTDLRSLAQQLGHSGLHLHANCTAALARAGWRLEAIIGELGGLEALGFDSYGIYNPLVPLGFARPAEEELPEYDTLVAQASAELWPTLDTASRLPFFPGVSPGYDESPRTIPDVTPWWEGAPRARAANRTEQPDRRNWPGTGLIVVGETPEAFEVHVRDALTFLRERPETPPVVTIGCWNEFTEGQYLLPDTRFGYGMLQALARARSGV